MTYFTIVRCPVCSLRVDEINHDEPELSGMASGLLLGDSSRLHAKQSPACKQNEKWYDGWAEKPRPKLTLAETLAAGLLPEDQIPDTRCSEIGTHSTSICTKIK